MGLNLHGIVRGAIPAVNPDTIVVMASSTGYTVADDGPGTQVPTYDVAQVRAQIQANTYKDLEQLDGINQNGEMRSAYLFGLSHGVVRSLEKGGDTLTWQDEDGGYSEWLVVKVLEQWQVGWVKVAIVRQNETGAP